MIPAVLAVLYAVLLVLVTAAGTALSVLAWWRPNRSLVYASAGAVAVALLLASVSAGEQSFPVTALITTLALATAVVGGGPVATLALRLATQGSVAEGTHGGILQDGSEVLRGGTAIGVLERLAVAGVLIAGFPEGLAVIVAIKGVGRFTELETGPVRERFIVGTLASWIWAAAAAGIVLLVR